CRTSSASSARSSSPCAISTSRSSRASRSAPRCARTLRAHLRRRPGPPHAPRRGRRPTRSPLVARQRSIVHVADPLAEEGLALLRARCEVRQTTGLKEPELASRVADVDALIVRSETKVTAAILGAAKRLQVVGRAGVGVDNIDVPAATARGVYVVNAPLGNIAAAAEHTMALALALVRRVVEADRSVRAGEWTRAKFMGRELRAKTLGLVGIGRVGGEVARRAAGAAIRKAPRTVLTPHIAGSTVEAQTNVAVDVVEQVLDVLDGKPARFAVNAPRPPAEEAGGLAWLRLAERLGSLAAQLLDDRPAQLTLAYGGAVLEIDPEPLRAAAVRGLLETFSEERVNLVNALELARTRGLVIAERRETEPQRYASLLSVRVGHTEVAGTLVQGEPRIVFIDGFWVDVPVEGHLLLTKHQDKPGLVGRVGTLLGEHDVNISSMQVGRLHPRGEALMILTLDDPVPDEVRARIGAFADINAVRTARLGVG